MTRFEDDQRHVFIKAHTTLKAPPLVPEVRLHLASEAMELWRETEALAAASVSGLRNLPPPYWAFAWPAVRRSRAMCSTIGGVRGKVRAGFRRGLGTCRDCRGEGGRCSGDCGGNRRACACRDRIERGGQRRLRRTDRQRSHRKRRRWHTVLAGDMCYERPLAERLTVWLRDLARQGTRVLLGDPGRNYFPADGVEPVATYSVPTSRDLEDREVRETSVYSLLAK
jgi:predicted nicotinamide N-methyase